MSHAALGRPIEAGDRRFVAPLRAVEDVRVSPTEHGFTLHATALIDAGEPHLRGHFPALAVYPGVFIIETVRQAVALALAVTAGAPADIVRLRSARFLAPLLAGDLLTVDATVRSLSGDRVDVDARCTRRDGREAARVRLEMDRP